MLIHGQRAFLAVVLFEIGAKPMREAGVEMLC
jgi:hypothetical protein